MKIQGVKGANDILPAQSGEWQFLEEKTRALFELFGFREIRTPIFEHTELFVRSVGEGTDIVSKEMYTFEDRGEKKLTLRPEATACVVRAYLEHSFHVQEPFQKWYYLGPMFRRERPQAGRYRQFHQIGVEVLGGNDASLDGEILALAYRFFTELGLEEIKIQLNSVGCADCRKTYSHALHNYLKPLLPKLCETCHTRFEKNILRVLDCKVPDCKPVIENAPKILDSICSGCAAHFQKLQDCLKWVGVPYEIQPRLVRGLDYYTRTVFEITHPMLGAQDAIGAGGRYDNLIGLFGGPKQLGATGFALGVERILLALQNKKVVNRKPAAPFVFLVSLGEEAFKLNYELLFQLRQKGIPAAMDMDGKSVKAQMRSADKSQSQYALVRGDDEIKAGQVTVKNMREGGEEKVNAGEAAEYLMELLGI